MVCFFHCGFKSFWFAFLVTQKWTCIYVSLTVATKLTNSMIHMKHYLSKILNCWYWYEKSEKLSLNYAGHDLGISLKSFRVWRLSSCSNVEVGRAIRTSVPVPVSKVIWGDFLWKELILFWQRELAPHHKILAHSIG